MFEIDDPEIDVEELEERVRAAIEAKRGVRFTDEELDELRRTPLRPRLRREDLPTRLLEEIPGARSKLPRVPAPPVGDLPEGEMTPEGFFTASGTGLRGRALRRLRALARPVVRALFDLPQLIHHIVHRDNLLKDRIDRQGEWAERQLSQMTGRIERWRERDLQLLHNLVYELSDVLNDLQEMADRLAELNRRLDQLEERERALEKIVFEEIGDAGRVSE